jgi:hypothetical protein
MLNVEIEKKISYKKINQSKKRKRKRKEWALNIKGEKNEGVILKKRYKNYLI